jgi:Leucine-rich repeat (LRR) protein
MFLNLSKNKIKALTIFT